MVSTSFSKFATSDSPSRRRFLWLLAVAMSSLAAGGAVLAAMSAGQRTVTLTGCLERDAASRTPIFKLVTRTASGSVLYRLTASAGIDFAAEIGHTMEMTGSLVDKDPDRPRDEAVLTVRSMRRISDRCQ